MEYRDLKKILDLMVDTELSELEIEDKGFRLCARRGSAVEQQYVVSAPPPVAALPAAPAPAEALNAASPASPAADEGGEAIVSPVVGTFYRSPTPEADAFVKVGDQVDEDTVVCIIEAMKVMNEIKAERKGIIKKVLLDNGDPVEYGQPLYAIEAN